MNANPCASCLTWVLLACLAGATSACGKRSAVQGVEAGPLNAVGGAGVGDLAVETLPKPEFDDGSACLPQREIFVPRDAHGRVRIELLAQHSDRQPWVSEQRVGYRDHDRCGYLDQDGFVRVAAAFTDEVFGIRPFSEGLAAVSDHGRCGYIDRQGKVCIPLRFGWASDFRDGIAGVRDGEQWGVIRRDGTWLIAPALARADALVGGLRIERRDGTSGWVHADGRITVDP